MNTIRIGVKASELGLWHANTVAGQLNHFGFETEIITTDAVIVSLKEEPLYTLGSKGNLTRTLDIALLQDKIDIAIHDLEDVPTTLQKGIVQAAVLKRGNHNDVLIIKDNEHFFSKEHAIIAIDSIRRKAQWLHRYPNHTMVNLEQGTVLERLESLDENEWDGAIFTAADLRRLKLLPPQEKHLNLDWMLPSPGQGAVMIATLESNVEMLEACKELNDENTALCVQIERTFLENLQCDTTIPVGALAIVRGDEGEEELKFKGAVFSHDGKHKVLFTKNVSTNNVTDLGEFAAQFVLDRGGKRLMRKEINIDKETLVYSTKHLSIAQTSVLSSKVGVNMSDFVTIRYNRLKSLLVKNPIQNVVITNQNALASLLQSFSAIELDFKNIYCVGRRTKRLVEKKIGKVVHVENSVEKLAVYLATALDEKSITFFCGNESDQEIGQFEKNKIEVTPIEVYKTLLTPKMVAEKHQAILFFSPTAVESYLQENTFNTIPVFCSNEAVAAKATASFSEVITAKLPTVESLLKEINTYFSKM